VLEFEQLAAKVGNFSFDFEGHFSCNVMSLAGGMGEMG